MENKLYSQTIYNVNFKAPNYLYYIDKAKDIITNKKFSEFDDCVLSDIPSIKEVFVENDNEKYKELIDLSKKFTKIIIVGVGGSSLGAKAISSIKYNEKIDFIESIDADSVKNNLNNLNFKETLFIFISKSGETIETICHTLLIIDKFRELNIKNFNKQCIFVTEDKDSTITKIAKDISGKIYIHPSDIGGRFSCFSIVGILPALLSGINVESFKKGAREVVKNLSNNQELVTACATQLSIYENGYNNIVMMPYIDSLKNFTDWYRQICAESLGKNNFGITPINSLGTIDQHSQLQLYIDGPKNKFFNFFIQDSNNNDFLIKDIESLPTIFGGKKLHDIVCAEQYSTIEIIKQNNLPVRTFKIKEMNEETLGALMMNFFIEIIVISQLKSINPFNQPKVEERKILSKKLITNVNNA